MRGWGEDKLGAGVKIASGLRSRFFIVNIIECRLLSDIERREKNKFK